MEDVADHYKIPSIHMGYKIALMEKEGKIEMKATAEQIEQVFSDATNRDAIFPKNKNGKIPFSKDGVHPYINTGHTLYMEAIARSMDLMKNTGRVGRHIIPSPLNENNWEDAKMYPLEKAKMEGSWVKLSPEKSKIAKLFEKRIPSLWKAKPGATLKFTYQGKKTSIYDLLGPGSGYVSIKVDGKVTKKSKRIDGYSNYYRLSVLEIADGSKGKHTIEITVLDEPLNKANILHKDRLDDMKKYPNKYSPTNWYAGGIFIIGDLIN
jgi:hypothetical protein